MGLDDPYPLGEMESDKQSSYPGKILDLAMEREIINKKEYDDTCHTPINECSYEWRSVLSKEDLSLIRIYYKGV